MLKIVTIVGARPQFIKAAAVSRAIKDRNLAHAGATIKEIIVHTGQHYDVNMSDIFFNEMKIPKPDYNLGIGGGTHGEMTGKQLQVIESILIDERPDAVLVYGDTNSTLSGALAASKLKIPVIHIEAGLRSNNMQMPEEINRILTDNLSTLLFCPSSASVHNLHSEGFNLRKHCKIYNVGDVMHDAVKYYRVYSEKPKGLVSSNFILLTFHRAENTDNLYNLKNIVNSINKLSEDIDIVIPLHPRTKKILENNNITINAEIIPPVGYFQMLWLIENSKVVMTDSGGLQKEAYFLGKGCVTLRNETEWTELVEEGFNFLVGTEENAILAGVSNAVNINSEMFSSRMLYGDGATSKVIVEVMTEHFK
ncbi:non-hydrolyzing UDP-N-acetylglucosamine 2-epimerase [Pseudidiomarina sp. E22-M8]|uniref:non-hydrolyzing UDP-N-acetylglucosamine 2-epimerase n=1 Tax=Pseudidiomarina sp. E22-M8 TaxID=3424768 RepID=UPI00403C8D60